MGEIDGKTFSLWTLWLGWKIKSKWKKGKEKSFPGKKRGHWCSNKLWGSKTLRLFKNRLLFLETMYIFIVSGFRDVVSKLRAWCNFDNFDNRVGLKKSKMSDCLNSLFKIKFLQRSKNTVPLVPSAVSTLAASFCPSSNSVHWEAKVLWRLLLVPLEQGR